jgi:hypothetical protein
MGGIKQTYVCIEEEELNRLKYNEARLHAMKAVPREKINHIRQDVENQLREKLERVDRRHLELQQYVYDLNGTMRYLEIENQRKFSQQNEKIDLIRQEYFTLLRMERDEYLSLFEQMEQKFTVLIEETIRDRQMMEVSQENKIGSILKDQGRREKVKNFTAELAVLIRETVKIPHQQFAPGRFEKIKSQLQTAVEDINSGFFETALSTSRNAYWQLVELRSEVLQKEHELITLYSAINEVLAYLTEKAALNRKRTLDLGNSYENPEIEIDIDYWTNGEFSGYENEMKAFRNFLLKNEKQLSIEDLKDLIRKIEQAELRIAGIMERARENILSSQLRANIAQKTVQALKDQLFTVVDSTYENNDPRNSYYVKLKNRAGNEIVTIIKPVADQFGKNEITIHFYDNKLVNQNTFHDRLSEITSAFSRHGLEIGIPRPPDALNKPGFTAPENPGKGRMSVLDSTGKSG